MTLVILALAYWFVLLLPVLLVPPVGLVLLVSILRRRGAAEVRHAVVATNNLRNAPRARTSGATRHDDETATPQDSGCEPDESSRGDRTPASVAARPILATTPGQDAPMPVGAGRPRGGSYLLHPGSAREQ